MWNRLTTAEKEEFERLLQEGHLGNLIELEEPWWKKKVHSIVFDVNVLFLLSYFAFTALRAFISALVVDILVQSLLVQEMDTERNHSTGTSYPKVITVPSLSQLMKVVKLLL